MLLEVGYRVVISEYLQEFERYYMIEKASLEADGVYIDCVEERSRNWNNINTNMLSRRGQEAVILSYWNNGEESGYRVGFVNPETGEIKRDNIYIWTDEMFDLSNVRASNGVHLHYQYLLEQLYKNEENRYEQEDNSYVGYGNVEMEV